MLSATDSGTKKPRVEFRKFHYCHMYNVGREPRRRPLSSARYGQAQPLLAQMGSFALAREEVCVKNYLANGGIARVQGNTLLGEGIKSSGTRAPA